MALSKDAIKNLLHVFEWYSRTPNETQKNASKAASWLAVNGTLDTLAPLFEGYKTAPDLTEVFASLLQELVLRGEVNDEISPPPLPLQNFQSHLAALGHPLSWLPLHTVSTESEHEYDLRGFKGLYNTTGMAPAPEMREQMTKEWWGIHNQVGVTDNPPQFSDLTTEAIARHLNAAFDYGKTETRELGLSRVLLPTEFTAYLLSLTPLECLQGSSLEEISVVEIAPTEAWEELFMSVSGRNLFGDGLRPAYDRLNAWRSLAALAGCAPEATFGDVVAQVEACHFWSFYTPNTSWFFHIFNDVGLAALRPDGLTMAFVVMTQTD